MTQQILGDGLVVSPKPARSGEVVYAELTPASPLLRWEPARRGWRRRLRMNGLEWDEVHIRWWFEIHSTNAPKSDDNPTGHGFHYLEHDGGAVTLRRAIVAAGIAVQEVVDTLDGEA